jgi:hypothetical protein
MKLRPRLQFKFTDRYVTGNGGFQINVQGTTALTGAAITSTDAAVTNNANTLATHSISATSLANSAAYNAQSTSIGASYSGANANGTQSGYNGFNAAPPSALSATGNASSTTTSGISGFNTTNANATNATNPTNPIPTTGTVDTTVRTGNTNANTLAPIFNPTEIKAGFAIVTAASQQANTYIDNQLKQADSLKEQAKKEIATGTPEALARAAELNAQAAAIEANWGNGAPARSATTAFLAAMSGNVTGTASQWLQSSAVNYLQGQAASWIKDVSDNSLGLSESSPLRAALHAIAACAGQAAQHNSAGCGAAALGAATASLINGLANEADGGASTLTNEQKEARKNLLTNLIAGMATAAGSTQTSAAVTAATIETENNSLTKPSPLDSSFVVAIRQALLKGDVVQLRLLLEAGGAGLTPHELVIAQRALVAMETMTQAEIRLLIDRYGIDFVNKAIHIFNKPGHNLAALEATFPSAGSGFAALQRALEASVANAAAGATETIIAINGFLVTVRYQVIDGITKISTLFIPK